MVMMGIGVVWVVHNINYQIYGRMVWALYTLAFTFTALTYILGDAKSEAQRWLTIPIVNFSFQPSDFLKVATVMVVARELARRQKVINRIPLFPPLWGGNRKTNKSILLGTTMPLFSPILLSCAIVVSANLSTALVIFATCVVMLFIGRVRVKDLFKFVMLTILMAALVLGFLTLIGKTPARMATWENRIEHFLGVGEKADDADYDYQTEQAKIAIASGGVTGRGVGESIQRNNLPLAWSDYAYAFIIEEYGAIVGGFVLLLYLWIFFRAIVIFRRCGTAFPSMLVLGLALLVTLQAITNMMVSVNLIPSTGLTLPLISKGGSSELFISIALGMILGVSRQTLEQSIDRPKDESLLE
jgi:cell division protein FtsW